MLKVNTKLYKPIEIEIDEVVYKTKKITNKVILDGLKYAEILQSKESSLETIYGSLANIVCLYLPVTAEWVMDNLSPDEMREIIDEIQKEITKSTTGTGELPLAGGSGGNSSPK